MADLINFTLPTINEGTDEKTLKQIKNYLSQLTEQMRFYLNNIDSDNFTDAYNQKLAVMATSQTTNANQLSVTQQTLQKFKDQLTANMQDSVDRIVGNKGGYVILHDSNNDTFPDEILIMNTSDINTATKIWRWNQNGLMFNNGGYNKASAWNTTVAIDMEGHINANYITVGTLTGINIKAVNISGESLIEGGLIKGARIEADNGVIGGWIIDDDSLYSDYGIYRAYIQTPTASRQWVFSTQKKLTDTSYEGTFLVMANGDVHCHESVYCYRSLYCYETLHCNEIAGDQVVLRHGGSGVVIQYGSSKRITFDFVNLTIGESTAYRDVIASTGGLVIRANGGKNTIYLQGSAVRLMSDTYLNIVTDSTIPLMVNASGKITITSSSERYKENITEELECWLNPEKLYDLPVVQYNYKEKYKDLELVAGTQIGIKAEDVEKYYPNALIRNSEGQAESWQDRIMIPAMLKLIQNLKKEIDELKIDKGA